MTNTSRFHETYSIRRWIVASSAALAAIVTSFIGAGLLLASDPSPVNPPGPLPQFLADEDGNRYEIFLPEEGGSVSGDGFWIVAEPGDVPSATFVGIRMTEGGEASNLGMMHHRYTISGNYYHVDALDENERIPDPKFAFRNPAEACVPVPMMSLSNIVDVRMVATEPGGKPQTVLNSGVKSFDGNLMVCGYVGSVPTVLAAGVEGVPGPEPTMAPTLPETGGWNGGSPWLALLLAAGSVLTVAGLTHCIRMTRRRGRVA